MQGNWREAREPKRTRNAARAVGYSPSRRLWRRRMKRGPALLDQVLEAVDYQGQRRRFVGVAVLAGGLLKLRPQDIVDATLDRVELEVAAGLGDLFGQAVQPAQRMFCRVARILGHELPGRGKYRCQRAK